MHRLIGVIREDIFYIYIQITIVVSTQKRKNKCKLNASLNFFINRISSHWKNISRSITSSESLASLWSTSDV